MKVNHLNLSVSDVMAARTFLETYFGLKPLMAKANDTLSVLQDDNGSIITLMNVDKREEIKYPSRFHVGFIQESEAAVDALNQRLKDGGYAVEPPSKQHGSWTFYLTAPGGFIIEVLA